MSKYTFYNKIISDDDLIIGLVSKIHKQLGYSWNMNMENIKEINEALAKLYKINISYKFIDFKDANNINHYGIKSTTNILVRKYPSNYYVIFDSNQTKENNRLLFLHVVGHILLDSFKADEEKRCSLKELKTNDEILAQMFAEEFSFPRWKVKYYMEKNYSIESIVKKEVNISVDLIKKRIDNYESSNNSK